MTTKGNTRCIIELCELKDGADECGVDGFIEWDPREKTEQDLEAELAGVDCFDIEHASWGTESASGISAIRITLRRE